MSGVRAISTGPEILGERLMSPSLPIGGSGSCFQARTVLRVVALQYFVDVFIATHYQEFRTSSSHECLCRG
jgi:hypothetical protein